tara:strand:+ start:8363 stop:8872 length:510 start_codon:yes stop_codon:yes gene_type:complete
MLDQFRPRKLAEDNVELLDTKEITQDLKVELPQSVEDLLQFFDGAIVFEKRASFPATHSIFSDEDGMLDLEVLYGRSNGFWGIVAANKRYTEYLPVGSLAIGEVAGGNVIGVSLKTGAVFLFIHDELRPSDAIETLYLSIDEFWSALEIGDEKRDIDTGVDYEKLEWKL